MEDQSSKLISNSVDFRGNAKEFFRIWIVNTLLTIVTLGIYSAWAKVRTNRYFYGNTFLQDTSFGYHAKPIQILKGRIIVAIGIGLYVLLAYQVPGTEGLMILAFLLLTPWLIVKSLIFRMANTSYRNIRFGFNGTVGQSYIVGIKSFIYTVFTLGIAIFWADWARSSFVINGIQFGRSKFATNCTARNFFSIYIRMIGISILLFGIFGVIFALITGALEGYMLEAFERTGTSKDQTMVVGIGMAVLTMLVNLPIYLFLFSYLEVRKFNLLASTTSVDGAHHLQSTMKLGAFYKIYLTNMIAIILSLGLLIPWAKIRITRYRLSHVQVLVAGNLDQIVASENKASSATGEEIGDYMDLDLGF